MPKIAPYQILHKFGVYAYEIPFPPNILIYPIFNVLYLTLFKGGVGANDVM